MTEHNQQIVPCPVMGQSCPPLTEPQIEAIATRAAEVALERVYTEIGRSVVKQALYVLGAGALALYAWAKGRGLM